MCCGYSKEPSQRDGSFEHSKQNVNLMDKEDILFFEVNTKYFIECVENIRIFTGAQQE